MRIVEPLVQEEVAPQQGPGFSQMPPQQDADIMREYEGEGGGDQGPF